MKIMRDKTFERILKEEREKARAETLKEMANFLEYQLHDWFPSMFFGSEDKKLEAVKKIIEVKKEYDSLRKDKWREEYENNA
jgi:hypothetical protein